MSLGTSFAKNSLKILAFVWSLVSITGYVHADALDNWAANQVSTNFSLTDVTHGNGRYVAVGYYPNTDSGVILTSDDGLGWTQRNQNNIQDPTFDLYSVTYGTGVFVGVGFGTIFRSTN